ncbi:MAG: glycosyltransferase family 39 protein [Pyrinomonadaceae bacterium]
MVSSTPTILFNSSKTTRLVIWVLAIALLFALYLVGIGNNPPGFYVDESGLAYNAYLVSTTGAGEFGPQFPLFFQLYAGGFTQYSNPTQIYLLALIFKMFGPGILTARLLAAASVFAASLLLGLLASRVSGRRAVGIIVGVFALLTPWLFEVGRLVLETFFYPMAVVLFLWAVYNTQRKDRWTWAGVLSVVSTLTLLTYSYTIGRLLGPLLALSLICFAVDKSRIVSIFKTWVLYGLTLIPLAVFIWQNPDITTRFYLLSYLRPESSYFEIFIRFAGRFVEDLNPIKLIVTGDINPRHHLPDAFGSFFAVTLILAVAGIFIVLIRHRSDPWWRFVLLGLLASVVPGALTVDSLHTLRMIAHPIFLLLLMVPALELLFEKKASEVEVDQVNKSEVINKSAIASIYPVPLRQGILAAILTCTVLEASYFYWKYYQEGPNRREYFDADYKPLYDAAVEQPNRPIYLVDDWQPAYIHSFWYATLEGRDIGEFVHLPYRRRPPAGAVVISSEQNCTHCTKIRRSGDYMLYETTK